MKLEFNEDQELFRGAVGDLLASAYPSVEVLNDAARSELGWRREVWSQAAEMGVLGAMVDEGYGGLGAGPLEMAAILLEVGRRLAPEPYLDCAFLPALLIGRWGSDEQKARFLPGLAEGELLVAFAHEESGLRWPDLACSTKAGGSDGTFTISGTKSVVPGGDCCDTLIVSAALESGGVGLFVIDVAAPGVSRAPYRTYDRRRGAEITLSGVTAEPLGAGGDATEVIRIAQSYAVSAQCAEAVGSMEESLRLTVDYLKQRKQFGKTLSQFQALTHRAVDMYVALEAARSMCFYLAASLEDGVVDDVTVSRAKVVVGRAARFIGQQSVQMHGGIGITAEYTVGHHFSRLTALGREIGTVEDHMRRLSCMVAVDGDGG
ncbi:acyl-CoA dehydrogenase [Gordonia sp. SID5947]|uniref:acyl-CoA dehydrogenase family protein n=1 Tax=Gordonia sp. SID5947 TaxID=2690315 RepID=UPI00136AA174|nr:acyl-CoA dehydrogenase family protein [Gordonia sp. SID5947]MYR07970.1 acyl-CoA dehydrogenase [Gordonia sp. SID5947]